MKNESLVDYAKNQIEKSGLPIDISLMVIGDINNVSKEDIDGRIDLLTRIIDEKTSKAISETKAKFTEVTKEDFEKMGYQERLKLYNTNRELSIC